MADGATLGIPPVTPQALTNAQRLHFDVYGFVLLPGVLTPGEVEDLRRAMRRLQAETALHAHRIYLNADRPHIRHFGHLLEYDEAFLRYATHPRLVAAAEEVVGGRVRIEETEAIINRRDPRADPELLRRERKRPTGFHTGTEHGWGTYEEGGRLHCLFVKTLAYLTDVGPEDGGTAVIPGSHRLSWTDEEIIAAAREDPELVYQVEAAAGSVLLFCESLIHSTTAITSDRERMVVITGYTPPMMQVWPGNEPSPAFVEALPAELRRLVAPPAWPWERPGRPWGGT
jgi:hypothetical protein